MTTLYYGGGNCSIEGNDISGVEINYRGAISIKDKTSDSYFISANDNKIIIFPIKKYSPLSDLFSYKGEIRIKSVIVADSQGERVSCNIKRVMDYSELLKTKAEDLDKKSEHIRSTYLYGSKIRKTKTEEHYIRGLSTYEDNAAFYLPDGEEYFGDFHIHPNGTAMSGATHTKASVVLSAGVKAPEIGRGEPPFPTVVSNYSLDFGGTDEYVTIGDQDIFSFTNDSTDSAFSISAWVKIADSEALVPAVMKNDDNSPHLGEYEFFFVRGKISMQIIDGSSAGTYCMRDADSAVSTDEWHHLVGVYDGTGATNGDNAITLYVDGSVTASTGRDEAAGYGSMVNRTSSLRMGVVRINGTSNHYAVGKIDEVALYSKALSASEVLSLQGSANKIGDARGVSGLVGYWRMEEGSGTTVADLSDNSNDGTMSNMESGDWSTDGATN